MSFIIARQMKEMIMCGVWVRKEESTDLMVQSSGFLIFWGIKKKSRIYKNSSQRYATASNVKTKFLIQFCKKKFSFWARKQLFPFLFIRFPRICSY